MEGANLQKQIDGLRDSIDELRSQLQGIVDEMGMMFEYQPKQYKLVKKSEVKESAQSIPSF